MKYIVTWRTPLTIFFTVKTSNYIHGETRTSVVLLVCVNSPRVLFFILGFWLRFNSNLTSKSGLLCKQVRLYSLFKEKPQKVDFKETDTVYNLTWFSFAISQKEDSYRFYFVPHVCQKVPYFFKIFQLQKTIFWRKKNCCDKAWILNTQSIQITWKSNSV